MTKKYKLELSLWNELKQECAAQGKVPLLKLKSLAKAYAEWYPGSLILSAIDAMSTKTARKFLIEHFCKNMHNLKDKVHGKLPSPPAATAPKPPGSTHVPKTPMTTAPKPPGSTHVPKTPMTKPATQKPGQPSQPSQPVHNVLNLPIVKPKPTENLSIMEVKVDTKKADVSYLTSLKKTISELENKGYNIDAFEKDIQDDAFVKKALNAHIEALEWKLKAYKKLAQVNWQGHVGGNGKQGHTINLNEVIKNLQTEVSTNLLKLKTNPHALANKRQELMSILYDPDNGIATIRGKSRESVRISIIKLIYMFIKVPTFFFKGFINFMLTGPAGSGKTKIASAIAHTMKNLGILATKKVVMATKQNLVGEFIGHSGPKTRSLLAGSLEGVVFIDEAYTLTPCPTASKGSIESFSEEAVGELINFVDKFIGCLVVIVAGYKDKMYDCFLTFNEGMGRRFPKIVDLTLYNSDDMYDIFETFLGESIDIKATLTTNQRVYIKSVLSKLNDDGIFNNQAGDMLNLSKVIGEDATLFGEDYNKAMIELSFKKFCATKQIAVDF